MKEREIVELFLKLIKGLCPISLFFLISCSGEPPQINELWWQLDLSVDSLSDEAVESLSLFVHAEDEDGADDLNQLYLINDDFYYVWNIPSDLWLIYEKDGVKWIGINDLRAPGEGHFPDGNYRVLVVDLGGERVESSFYLRNSIPELDTLIFPEIKFDNDFITINSDFPSFKLWFYDVDDTLIDKSEILTPGNYEWNRIIRNINRRAASFSLYTEPENGSWGLISGPFLFNN